METKIKCELCQNTGIIYHGIGSTTTDANGDSFCDDYIKEDCPECNYEDFNSPNDRI